MVKTSLVLVVSSMLPVQGADYHAEQAKTAVNSILAIGAPPGAAVSVADVVAALMPNEAALIFTTHFLRSFPDPGSEHIAGYLITKNGIIFHPSLGLLSGHLEQIAEWEARGASGRSGGSEAPWLELGDEIRKRLVDPFESGLNAICNLRVVMIEGVNLFPIDALPVGNGQFFGSRCCVSFVMAPAQLVLREVPSVEKGADFLVVGGIDYNGYMPGLDAARDGVTRVLRKGSLELGYPSLLGSLAECERIYTIHEVGFGDYAGRSMMSGQGVTPAKFMDCAESMHYIHLAVHAFAMNIAERSGILDEECGLVFSTVSPKRSTPMTVSDDSILTGSMISRMDLSNCKLVVLSTGDCSVGLPLPGRVQNSVAAAFIEAGANCVVTSAYSVNDGLTAELFDVFYQMLWRDKKTISEALWAARMAMREQYGIPEAWAGWLVIRQGQ